MPWKETSVMDERLRFVARLLEGERMTHVCREFGISRKTGYKIVGRYKEHGLEALTDRSRRPVRHANQLPSQIETTIVRAKQDKPHRGARKIRDAVVNKTKRSILGGLGSFLRWARREGLLATLPEFPRISVPERAPVLISRDEQARILGFASTPLGGEEPFAASVRIPFLVSDVYVSGGYHEEGCVRSLSGLSAGACSST